MSSFNLSPLSNFAARLRDAMGTPAFLSGEAEFQRFSLELFGWQFEHNSVYRQFCRARRAAPDSVRDWRNIPALPAAAFKEMDVTSLPVAERTRVFHSSGTTQQFPSRHFHNSESLELYETSLLAWFPAHWLSSQPVCKINVTTAGSNLFEKGGASKGGVRASAISEPGGTEPLSFLSLTPRSGEAPTSSLVHMFETLARKFAPRNSTFTGRVGADGGWEVDLPGTLEVLESAIARHRPLMLLGTAFGFVQLLDHLTAARKRLQLPDGSRILETGGYKGRSRALPKNELHSLISELLGVPFRDIVCEYGMSELSSQAYEVKQLPLRAEFQRSTHHASRTTVFHFPPWARAQIVSPETGREVSDGETGLIRVFDLANVWSVMAIQTEDLGVRRGDGFELIGRAVLAEPRGCSLMSV